MNDNGCNVAPFIDRKGLFTDFRVFIRDLLNRGLAPAKGIVVLVADDGTITPYYCGVDNRDLALIANYIAKDVT